MRCVTTQTPSFQGWACHSALTGTQCSALPGTSFAAQQNSLSSHSSSGGSGAAASLLRVAFFLLMFPSYHELQNRTRELDKQCARTSKSAWHLCLLIYISCFGKVAPADNLHQLIILLNSIVFSQLSHFWSFHFKTGISQVALFDIKQIITAPFTHPLPVRKVKTLD